MIQADLSCGSTIHLTSIDVILLSSPKVHTYAWILLQLFDSYYPDKLTHESNELVIKTLINMRTYLIHLYLLNLDFFKESDSSHRRTS